MKRPIRAIIAGLLVAIAAALVFAIVSLSDWGGRIETLLLVFGDRVWVTLDTGRPRLLLLLVAPAVILLGALSLYLRRSDKQTLPPKPNHAEPDDVPQST